MQPYIWTRKKVILDGIPTLLTQGLNAVLEAKYIWKTANVPHRLEWRNLQQIAEFRWGGPLRLAQLDDGAPGCDTIGRERNYVVHGARRRRRRDRPKIDMPPPAPNPRIILGRRSAVQQCLRHRRERRHQALE